MGKPEEQVQHLQSLLLHPGWFLLEKKLVEMGINSLNRAKESIRGDHVGSTGFWMGYHDAVFNVLDVPKLMIDDLRTLEEEGHDG